MKHIFEPGPLRKACWGCGHFPGTPEAEKECTGEYISMKLAELDRQSDVMLETEDLAIKAANVACAEYQKYAKLAFDAGWKNADGFAELP